MSGTEITGRGGRRCGASAALALLVGLALSISGGPAGAQQGPAKQASGAPQSAWVKLCEKATLPAKDKEGKEEKAEREVCLTHHERLDGATGMVLVSAAVRHIEGYAKDVMMVMVPLGMSLPVGVHTKVIGADLWAKVQQNEKVDDSKIVPSKLQFTLCHQIGCTAEGEVTHEMLGRMKAGGGLLIYTINSAGQLIVFPVPLTGFAAALDGPPADTEQYQKARAEMMKAIRQRQLDMIEQKKKEQGKAPAAPPKK